ncbi:MAG: hypothetical protein K9L02_03055 [Acholeplasmataceae bacterium]|nr:hypothetical protein [Acholeplasmataceae bacterium]
MNKGKTIFLFILLVLAIGFIPAIELVIEVLIMLNDVIFSVLNESILSFLFKHKVTYYIVGLILSSVSSYFGVKLGINVSRILYAIVAIGIAGILNFIMMIITLIF